ncbi:MAG: hypothetical protein P8J33_08980, partial [Pirellulaceae bacterium]|nr:hypothetical protein [Pirellulaceae bacterium]
MDKQIDSNDLDRDAWQEEESSQEFEYRSIDKSSVASVIFAVLGLAFVISKVLVVLPLIALALSLIALSNIRKYPEELIGRKPAVFAMVVALLVLVLGSTGHVYVYMTEVPEGYQRISFRMLKNDKGTELPYSEEAVGLDGESVFIRGYVRPGAKKNNLQKFILVGDFGSCCFGGAPEITDVVAISILGDERIDYGWGVRKIAGKFRLNKNKAPTAEKEVPKVFYQ